MSLTDGLIVLGIFGAFGFLIISKIHSRSPERVQWLYNLFRTDKKAEDLKDKMQQIYPEKRQIM